MREVVINGKSVKIETGIKIREPATCMKPKSDLRLLLEKMAPGESVFLPINDNLNRVSSTLSNTGRAMRCAFGYRKEGNGVRIFCSEPSAAPKKARRTRARRNRKQVALSW